MIVNTQELIGSLRAAELFASADITRPHMNCVHVEAAGSTLRIVSTDGHTMWACEIPARETAADPPPCNQVAWNIGVEDVLKIVGSLKGTRETELLLVKRTVGGVEYAQHAEHFPLFATVIPSVASTVAGKILPEFATDYVARCCAALTLYGKGLAPELPKTGSKHEKEMARAKRDLFLTPPIAWRLGGELDPALFYSPKFPCAVAIVMPRKGEGSERPVIESFVSRIRGEKSKAA